MTLQESGYSDMPLEYSFRFSLGELQLMLGIIDITTDSVGKQRIAMKNPDYNFIASDVNTRQRENMGEYRSFRRYSLDVATAEINDTDTSAFSIDYDVECEEGSRKVAYVIFNVRRKTNDNIVRTTKSTNDHADFIVDLARELHSLALTYDELIRISVAAEYDKNLIVAAKALYDKLPVAENFVTWFEELRS
jgi:hypothetical protein